MSIVEQFPSDGPLCICFFSVVLLEHCAAQMRKYTNAQIAVPASLIC